LNPLPGREAVPIHLMEYRKLVKIVSWNRLTERVASGLAFYYQDI
jgi:hypothetical protein